MIDDDPFGDWPPPRGLLPKPMQRHLDETGEIASPGPPHDAGRPAPVEHSPPSPGSNGTPVTPGPRHGDAP